MTGQLLTPADVAERLGVPVSTVMEWRKAYSWPVTRIGRRFRWTERQFEQILTAHEVRPAEHSGKPVAVPGQTKRSASRSR